MVIDFAILLFWYTSKPLVGTSFTHCVFFFGSQLARTMPKALLLVGPPCSGKSYYCNGLKGNKPTVFYGGQEYGENAREYARRCRAALRQQKETNKHVIIEMWPEHLDQLMTMIGAGYLKHRAAIRFFEKLHWLSGRVALL